MQLKTNEKWVEEYRSIEFDTRTVLPGGEVFIRTLLAEKDQQLQKARHDWLREEIVKLEGMHIKYLPSTLKDPVGFCEGIGRNKTIKTIIDRYHSELDQDKVIAIAKDQLSKNIDVIKKMSNG